MESKKSTLRVLSAAVALVFFSGIAFSVKGSALEAGSTAPALSLSKLNGTSFDLASLRGKPVLLSFYTTWSDSCLENLRFLSSLDKNVKGIEVVTVAFENKPSTVSSFLKKNNLDLNTLLDSKKISVKDYEILIIPMTFLIDAKGIIDKIYVDFDDSVRESLRSDIRRLLSDKD